MIRLYHAPRTRSIRVLWLLEELGLPFELVSIEYQPPAKPFAQRTPSGKFPTLEDGDTVMFESGAIVEYVLERALQDRDYLPGTDFSAADIMMGYGVQWAAAMGLLTNSPNLRAYNERLSSRPALQKALAAT